MGEQRELDTRDSIRIVTANEFITACGLENVSLKARKLLYIAISQCKKTDEEFFTYRISLKEFAKLMNIDVSNLYKEAEAIADELSKGFIKVKPKSSTKFINYPLFSFCSMDNTSIVFEINKRMTDFLLGVKGSFTKPLLEDFLKMNSPFSMAIWHLMQREMKSQKAYGIHVIEFDLSLEEIRQVTGTCDKFERLSDIKRYVLDKAIREIKDNCAEIITYENIKSGRTVTGFHFKVVSENYIEPNQRTAETLEKLEKISNY